MNEEVLYMNKVTIEQGINDIMAIIDGNGGVKIDKGDGVRGGQNTPTISTISQNPTIPTTTTTPTFPKQEPTPDNIVYDGYGHKIYVNDKPVAVGSKKRRTKTTILKDDLVLAAKSLFERSTAFKDKVGFNKAEGIIIRLQDADYTVKLAGHAKRLFENREPDFVPAKSYITRGKAVNHAPAIAKLIANEFENQFPCASFGGFEFENQNLFTLLESKAAGVRFEIQNPEGTFEMTFKITKKRSRVVFGEEV